MRPHLPARFLSLTGPIIVTCVGLAASCARAQPASSPAPTASQPGETARKPGAPPTKGDEAFVQFTPPPCEATREEKTLLDRAGAVLDSKQKDVSGVLVDREFMPLHARTEFRTLIEKHAPRGEVTISGPDEPGTRMLATLEVSDAAGKPIADALVYAYHTSAKGWYSDKAAHIRADSGDHKHARLFGYARTDDKGRVVLKTIRPAGYPRSDLPEHIHVFVTIGGRPAYGGEIVFSDDPRLTKTMRERMERENAIVTTPEKLEDGSQKVTARIRAVVAAAEKPARDQLKGRTAAPGR